MHCYMILREIAIMLFALSLPFPLNVSSILLKLQHCFFDNVCTGWPRGFPMHEEHFATMRIVFLCFNISLRNDNALKAKLLLFLTWAPANTKQS